jgi:site-specific recombinase XerD
VRSFKAVLKRAGLPKAIRFNDLRHSYASYLVRLGVHPRMVMESMGHSQISLTMNTYSHVMSEQQREAADKLDGLLRRARTGSR